MSNKNQNVKSQRVNKAVFGSIHPAQYRYGFVKENPFELSVAGGVTV